MKQNELTEEDVEELFAKAGIEIRHRDINNRKSRSLSFGSQNHFRDQRRLAYV